jgi:Transglycosylase-like domain
MSGAPKAARTLSGLPGERELLGEEPFGPPQETITHPTRARTSRRRARAGWRGHYGLYQFSASTWAAYGGNPADFGSASVAEQNQVFANALASGGQSNWSAYDGC